MIFIAASILISIVIGSLWLYARWNHGTLEKLGIPVVEYKNPLLGSTRDITQKPAAVQIVKWMRKYGKIFGIYHGRDPIVYVCEPELIRLICVKDQEYFNEKRAIDFGDPMLNEMPDFLPYEKWKVVRGLITPAFTSAKIKLMNLPIRHATQDFVSDINDLIKEGNGICEKFAIDQSIYQMFTDLIARSFFSVQVADRTSKHNAFTQIITDMIMEDRPTISPEISMYCTAFPFLQKIINLLIIRPKPPVKFAKIFRQVMEERRKSGVNRNDVVDMSLEWWERLDSPEFQKHKITELTLLMQAMVFFAAAQDQLSSTVALVIYHIVKDAELEKNIYAEVDEAFANNKGKIEHEHLSQLPILNACISECLRLYPLFHQTDRVCSKDWHNEEFNLDIKKGTIMAIAFGAANRIEEYNENPDDFNYERFLPENKSKLSPYSSTAFGFGPRGCPGKQFAYEAYPIILAYLLKELKFIGRSDTQINMIPGGIQFTPHDGIYVDVVERKFL